MGLNAENHDVHHDAMEAVLQYSAEAKETQDKLNAKQVTTIQSTHQAHLLGILRLTNMNARYIQIVDVLLFAWWQVR